MTIRALLALAAIAAMAIPSSATAAPQQQSPIDITNAELVGVPGGGINVFGTIRCESAGQLIIDVDVTQPSSGGTAAGSSNSQGCAAAGDTVQWVVTATPALGFFVVGQMVHITAAVAVAANGVDEEDHLLRRAT